jgi:cation diffusion facilitator CzcD-associated flavoprotein CzcO
MVRRGHAGQRRSVAIIGAGIAGIAVAVRLRTDPRVDITIFEKNDDIGGTWAENTYPGAACDVPSHLYSFSFHRRYDWSRAYAPQPEILTYLHDTVSRFDLGRQLRLSTPVASAEWDEASATWQLRTATGEHHVFDFVVSCVGMLNVPKVIDLPGAADFGGSLFHSARWDHRVPLAGRRVGVVGVGSSAAQIVPAIADDVVSLHVFQREPGWVMGKPERAYTATERATLARSRWRTRHLRWTEYWRREFNATGLTPGSRVHRARTRVALAWLRDSVTDDATRVALTPAYPYGCKRPVKDAHYLATFDRPNVRLVTDPISHLTPSGVQTADGQQYEVDVLVCATGFHAADFLRTVEVAGRSATKLSDWWAARGGPEAFLGIMVPKQPNLFIGYGPNTNSSTTSLIFVLECQAAYIASAISWATGHRMREIEIRGSWHRAYNRWLQAKMPDTTWTSGCANYFRSPAGKLVTNWPHTSVLYRILTVLLRPRAVRFAYRLTP